NPAQPDHDDLNPEQRRAVEHGEGPLVVIAGAGTGKTRVIVERIRRLLETRADLAATEILALTYTHKAAGEMAWRVRRELGERAKGLVATTFHAFCKTVLQESSPGLRQIEDVEHWILLRRNIARLGLVHYRRRYQPGQFLTDFTKFFSRCQDELVSAEDYLRYVEGEAARAGTNADAETREEAEKRVEVARAYAESERQLREKNLLTFGGSLMETVRLLERDAAALGTLRARFRFILVDEFQDTNVAQIRLLGLLAGGPRNLFVVGDDDQAIYRFRGASFGSFRIFEREFLQSPGQAQPAPGTRLLLTRNYRSTKKILRLADAVIRNNGEANRMFPDKQLTTQNAEGDPIRIGGLPSEAAEAEWVAAQIDEEHARGRPWDGFAVLYRAHAHREQLVGALERRGIPFVIRKLSVFTNPAVRDLVAGLRWVDRPGDNVACARVLAIPRWGFSPDELVRQAQRAAKHPRKSLWAALGAKESGEALEMDEGAVAEIQRPDAGAPPAAVPPSLAELITLHERLHAMSRRESALAVFDELAAAFAMLPLPEEAGRRAFGAFRRFLEDWQTAHPHDRLRDFLEDFRYFLQAGGSVTLDEEHRGGEAEEASASRGDAVQLMTAHAAKGLEFDHVFVIRLNRGAFPVRNMRPLFEFPDALMKEELPKGDHHVLEERRLFYVALTRARRRLTLTTIVRERSKPSPFLEDIEQEMARLAKDVQRVSPVAAAHPVASLAHAPGTKTGEPPAAHATATVPGKEQETSTLFPDATESAYETSSIGAWAAQYRPPLARPLELSAESIESYKSCPQKFLFGNRWHVREQPGAAVTFGSVMHTTIQHAVAEWRKGQPPALDRLLALFDEEWRKRKGAGFEDSYQEESYREAGREQLRKFHARMAAAPPAVREQEKTFTLPLANDVVLTGRMDQINELPDRSTEIVDYKTGTPKTEKDLKKNLQLTLYALAARDVLDLGSPAVTFHFLENDSLVRIQRDAKDLAEAESIVQEVAAGIRAGQFPARPGFNCRFCDYRLICPAHERGAGAVTEAPAEE
ncbi:MAG TPA: ATP-dependent DNA helicase, partial [Candidatus Acidoferrales bacterium]|nr:ATP-dependent DNA helicase [Candidatus Acidoferrales bacterium]